MTTLSGALYDLCVGPYVTKSIAPMIIAVCRRINFQVEWVRQLEIFINSRGML